MYVIFMFYVHSCCLVQPRNFCVVVLPSAVLTTTATAMVSLRELITGLNK